MTQPGLLTQILARDPRTLVRLPEVSVDAAMAELRVLQEKVSAAALAATTPAPTETPAAAEPAVASVSASSGLPEGLPGSLSALATHVWRAKGKLVDSTTGEPKEETKRIYRHIEGAL